MRDVMFRGSSFDDFNEWSKISKITYKKIIDLIEDARRNPFDGIGKPEPLKHHYKGCWSRRIDNEHRLVYKVTDTAVEIVFGKFNTETSRSEISILKFYNNGKSSSEYLFYRK
jgi:toxin YoeB